MQRVKVWKPLDGDVEGVRKTFEQRMQKRYEGWSDTFDSQWDKNSFLFALEEKDTYLATCRLIIKRYHDITFKTAMEVADTQSYSLENYKNICVEGGMLSYSDLASFGKLMYHVSSWTIENDVDHLFTCYDLENPLIKRLYLKTLGFDIVEGANLVFGGFTSKKTSKDVHWQVVKTDRKQGKLIVENLRAYSENKYESGRYPSLKEWIENNAMY